MVIEFARIEFARIELVSIMPPLNWLRPPGVQTCNCVALAGTSLNRARVQNRAGVTPEFAPKTASLFASLTIRMIGTARTVPAGATQNTPIWLKKDGSLPFVAGVAQKVVLLANPTRTLAPL